MKKNKGLAYAALLIIFILFNVIAFVVPTEKTATFWIAYAFSCVAFILQIAVWNIAFKGTKTLKSKFLGISLIAVSSIYFSVQIAAFLIFMIFPTIASWISVISCSLILCISLICLIGTEVARDEIARVESKVEKKVFYIKSLQVDAEMLANTETDPDVKAALIKLAELIRFSDPMSNDALVDLEKEISDKFIELKTAEDKAAIIKVLDSLIVERNKKAKLLK